MKNILKLSLITLSLILLTSCVNDDETAIPNIKGVFFTENFSTAPINTPIALTGWSNVSLNGGARKWESKTFSGEYYTQLSAFGSGETNMNTWLITPSINLDQTENEAFAFLYKAAFYNGNPISVLISQNYDGSGTIAAVNAATWTTLQSSLPNYLTSGYPSNFSNSGPIDVSSFNGNVHIAIRYIGSSSGISTTYQIDDIKLYENN
jgi:hypothetical protein